MAKQDSFQKINWRHRFSHGGSLRRLQAGRGARPLSSRDSIHLVFKAHREAIKGGFRLSRRFALFHQLLQKYQAKFFIKVEQVSVQGDHIHLLIRTSRRSNYQSFFRVLAGQVAQRFEKQGLLSGAPQRAMTDTSGTLGGSAKSRTKLWKYRPFTRVVKSWRAYQVVRNYFQLNEAEAQGKIPYRKKRLKGLSAFDWEILWGLG